MAATKSGVGRRVGDFLPRELGQDRELGVFALRGPNPYLRAGLLALVWTVIPVAVLQLWKFRYLAVTREAVVVVTVSKFTLAPRTVESVTPRNQARLHGVHHGSLWTRFWFTDAEGAPHRYNISRAHRRDLDAFLDALGAPPRPGTQSEPTGTSHGRHSAPH
ncbi:hypothetical protein [Streptomyces sp. NPDC020917]|uniref:hypothetical protein n=1 Tax=Streptomyces sp. NPDC020917 TaxID=3365102 RepID=UPI0037988F36